MALCGHGPGGRGKEAGFHLAQLEQPLMVGAVRLTGFFLAGGQESMFQVTTAYVTLTGTSGS